jgi:hypothetical protein
MRSDGTNRQGNVKQPESPERHATLGAETQPPGAWPGGERGRGQQDFYFT